MAEIYRCNAADQSIGFGPWYLLKNLAIFILIADSSNLAGEHFSAHPLPG